ncbi:MAG: nucleotide exchange factor GrpE [Clostridiales bacterium]|jgi:molecular chaperone GrpE|nr:nucleotide exchange factor GrpE [Clostridiales bacterium]
MSKKNVNDNEKKNIKEKTEGQTAPAVETAAEDGADKLKAELAEAKNDYLRLAADFDNFRKRNNALNASLRETITVSVIEEFIPLADNYELALKYLDEKSKAGVMMIYRQLLDVFARFNVKEMDALGKPFDPVLHEAVEKVANSGAESGTIVEVTQKGYALGGNVVRCALVKVAE